MGRHSAPEGNDHGTAGSAGASPDQARTPVHGYRAGGNSGDLVSTDGTEVSAGSAATAELRELIAELDDRMADDATTKRALRSQLAALNERQAAAGKKE